MNDYEYNREGVKRLLRDVLDVIAQEEEQSELERNEEGITRFEMGAAMLAAVLYNFGCDVAERVEAYREAEGSHDA